MRRLVYLSGALILVMSACNKDEVIPAGGKEETGTISGNDAKLRIMPLSGMTTGADRYTFPGRKVCLVAVAPDYDGKFSWSVDGSVITPDGDMMDYTPEVPGRYTVKVEISTDGNTYTSECVIVAVDATEKSRMRNFSGASSAFTTEVFEYIPAPGQFVGEAKEATTQSQAAAWAQERLAEGKMVSLGALGGYLVAGFDHSVVASGKDYDFAIRGNAFVSAHGASNEPGIVWVMQDVNGNGLPDDEWYELRGSEYHDPATKHNTYITYFRPVSSGADVSWTDADGKEGKVTYLTSLKKTGRAYYPAWIPSDSYTLYGSRISPRNELNPSSGLWSNNPYPWGYADNTGSDDLGDSSLGPGSHCGFSISNAVNADGTPVTLGYIDFVKIQCATQAESGPLGEISTEVYSIRDLNIIK